MSKPFKVAQAFDFISVWNGTVGTSPTQIAFVPSNFPAVGKVPPGAPSIAVPVLVAHEILISNPSTAVLSIAVGDVASAGSSLGVKTYASMDGGQISSMKPMYLDPTTLPAIAAGNTITVPPGVTAFPIRVRAYGITIEAAASAAGVSIQAYGPISLLV